MMFFIPLLILLPAFAAQAQDQPPTFRAGVTLVHVDAQVTDRGGRPVPGLTKDDFEILDEGQPQKIAYFGHDSEPLDLILLLDVSGSMHRFLEDMAATARTALQALHEGDRVAVMLFARESAVREDFTGDFGEVQNEIRDAVRERSLGSGTAINAAIVAAANYAAKQPPRGRRAILIVTDNMSLNYRMPDEQAIRALYNADAVLNAILIGGHRRPDPVKPGTYVNPDFTPADVFKIADATGGEAIEARKAGESFQQMIERIRLRYALAYAAPAADPGTLRRITVELSSAGRRQYPKAVVHARAGYYAAR